MLVFLLAVLLSFVPALAYLWLVHWVDRYEKEPLLLVLAAFCWGAVVAVIGSILSQVILGGVVHVATGSSTTADVAGTTLFAPLTEEATKGFAVLIVFLLFRREFDSVLDGIVYAAATALGFAATENVLYLAGTGNLGGVFGLFLLRVVLGGWNHPFYTAFTGIGLALARLSPHGWVRLMAPPAGWVLSVFFHSLHNSLATYAELEGALGVLMFLIDWSGWFFMGGLVLWSVWHEGRLLGRYLKDEVARGLISEQHYRTAISSWAQTAAWWRAMGSGHFGSTRRFYQVCGELAHKKHHLATLGEEGRSVQTVQALRAELQQLAPRAVV